MSKVIRFAQQPEHKRLVYSTDMSVRWNDMDALGHVNNSIYFRYFEQARVIWLDDLKVDWGKGEEGPIVASASCDYFKPLYFPADLQIKIYSAEVQRASFILYYDLMLKDKPEIRLAQGATVIVWVDYATGKPISIPDNLRKLL